MAKDSAVLALLEDRKNLEVLALQIHRDNARLETKFRGLEHLNAFRLLPELRDMPATTVDRLFFSRASLPALSRELVAYVARSRPGQLGKTSVYPTNKPGPILAAAVVGPQAVDVAAPEQNQNEPAHESAPAQAGERDAD